MSQPTTIMVVSKKRSGIWIRISGIGSDPAGFVTNYSDPVEKRIRHTPSLNSLQSSAYT